jgi:hypothetical protein
VEHLVGTGQYSDYVTELDVWGLIPTKGRDFPLSPQQPDLEHALHSAETNIHVNVFRFESQPPLPDVNNQTLCGETPQGALSRKTLFRVSAQFCVNMLVLSVHYTVHRLSHFPPFAIIYTGSRPK